MARHEAAATTETGGDTMTEPVRTEPAGKPDVDGNGRAKPLTTRKAPRIGKSFSSRNPTPIGAIGLVFILALLYAAFNAQSLPLIGGGTSYSAMFTNASDLEKGDDVDIAGVRVGEVTSVGIDRARGQVKVSFRVKDGWVGNQSDVQIKLRTLLGQQYISIDSQGTKQLAAGATVPLSRTQAPFDVYPAFTAVTRTIQKINTAQLGKAFSTLAQDFSGTPHSVRPLVDGLSRLSQTISSRNVALGQLLNRAAGVTGVLAARDRDLQQILRDGSLLFDELNARRAQIHSLLVNTQTLSTQLTGLVNDNERTIGPAFRQIDKVLELLRSNQDSLTRGLQLLGPFYRLFNNVVGSGTWFDNYIQNLSIPGLATLPLSTTGG